MTHSNNRLTEELSVAQCNLSDFLGPDMKIYLNLLKSWFKKRISKQDFDLEARNLLCSDSIHLHNNFLLVLLAKCQSFGSSTLLNDDWRSGDQSQVSRNLSGQSHTSLSVSLQEGFNQSFMRADPLSIAPQIPFQITDPEAIAPGYAASDNLLPDACMIHGRLLVGAWERGLLSVDDQCVHLVRHAIEIQLKNILSSLSCKKRTLNTLDLTFYHPSDWNQISVSTNQPMTYHSLDEENEDDDDDYVHDDDYSSHPHHHHHKTDSHMDHSTTHSSSFHHISLFDLLHLLLNQKSVLPCHAIYTLNVERIINTMWHPSKEDDLAERIHHSRECT